MLIDYKQQIEHLKEIRKGSIKEGAGYGLPEVDEYFRFKPSNFNVILGHANVGKTTVALYLMLVQAQKNDIKWLVFSSENESHSVIRKLVEFLVAKPINKVSEEEFNKWTEWVNDRFKFIDCNKLYTYRSLLDVAKAVHNAWKFQGFFIDPYNSLIKDRKQMEGISGHDYDYEATTEMRLFCKENNVSIWLNTHANTQALRIKHPLGHEYVGHPIPPLASDVEGGGKFVNRADDFIVIHRYTQHPSDWMQSHIHVRKVKETDTGGRPTSMNEPIRMRSIPNNVGFEISGRSLLKVERLKQEDIPF
jgi:hypothetical protein